MDILGSSGEHGEHQRQVQKFRAGEVAGEGGKKDFMERSIDSWREERSHESLRDGNQGHTFFPGESVF